MVENLVVGVLDPTRELQDPSVVGCGGPGGPEVGTASQVAQGGASAKLPALRANGHHPAANGANGQAHEPNCAPAANGIFELRQGESGWTVPREEMGLALTAAKDVPSLQRLHAAAASVEDAARHYKLALEKVSELVEFRIRVERQLGALLAQTVMQGGHGSKSHDVTSIRGGSSAGLPKGISGMMSSRLQRLAAIDEEVVKRCFLEARRKGRVPSSEGLLRSVGFKKGISTKPRARKAPAKVDCPSVVADAIARFMKVGTCVGHAATFASAKRLAPKIESIEELRGIVFVSDCPDPDEWLPELAQAERKRQVEEVAVFLPADTGDAWFARIIEGGWQCCFLHGQPAKMVAYHGERTHAYWLVMQSLGCVMEPRQHH